MNPSLARVVVPPLLSRSMTEEERRRTEENRAIAYARLACGRAKINAHGHGTKKNSSSASVVVSPPLSRLNQHNVPMLQNGKILLLRGAQHGDATVAMNESVVLVREPHNVSLFQCQMTITLTNFVVSVINYRSLTRTQ